MQGKYTAMKPAYVLFAHVSAAALLAIAAVQPAMASRANRSVEEANQPVVQRTDYVFDVTANGLGSLSEGEQGRLLGWFDAIGVGYGDRIAIADNSYANAATAADIARLVERYGLFLADAAPVSAGSAPTGGTRVVVSRSTAFVPNCPNWKGRFEGEYQGGTTFNYGCATNGNLAAMVADPEDLVRGRDTRTDLRVTRSTRAIRAFNEAAPTGGGGNTLAGAGQ